MIKRSTIIVGIFAGLITGGLLLFSGNQYYKKQIKLYEEQVRAGYEQGEMELRRQLRETSADRDRALDSARYLDSAREALLVRDSLSLVKEKSVKGSFKSFDSKELERLMNEEYARAHR